MLDVIYNEDCLEGMRRIPDGSVDMILCDLPYGVTRNKWDNAIPLELLWERYKCVAKGNAAIVLTASQPFTSQLVMSNPTGFRYEWIWDKKIPSGMAYARYQPMRQHESILVFSREKAAYYPQMTKRAAPIQSGGQGSLCVGTTTLDQNKVGGFCRTYEYKNPTTLLSFDKVRRASSHPTQKPVALFEYLIRTYTNHGETVLDSCMGSGTTAIACINTGRHYIGFEKDAHYFAVCQERIHAPRQCALAECG